MSLSFHVSQTWRAMLRVTLVLAAAAVPAVVHAQSSTSADSASDSTAHSTGQVMHTVVVTASRRAPTLREEGVIGRILRTDREHRQVVGMMADNHKLAAYVNWQGHEITRLENRLTYLKTTVTDSIQHQIAVTDSATASVHAQRLALEARLAELEARQLARRAPDAAPVPVPSSTPPVASGGDR